MTDAALPAGRAAVRAAFDAAAPRYDAAARVQRLIAERLASRILAAGLPADARILEIGCGTGFLTRRLARALPDATLIATDIAPAMVEACRAACAGLPNVQVREMDGERPDQRPGEPERFDLVCSSLAIQWFDHPADGLRRLAARVAPGGRLVAAVLSEGSFSAWRAAHAAAGVACAARPMPSVEDLEAGRPSSWSGGCDTETVVESLDDPRAFPANLKAVGAAAAHGVRPLGAGAFRRVLRAFADAGPMADYEVTTLDWRRPPRPGVFVTGTDTGVGKTVVSACLVAAWGADYFKPVQTGLAEDVGDSASVAALAQAGLDRIHTPAVALLAPLSPHAAAALEGVAIDLSGFRPPPGDAPLVVEGAGGVLVPIDSSTSMLDLAGRLALPVIVVVRDRLGAINHALLTLQTLRRRRLAVFGVVMVGDPFADNAQTIAALGEVPILARLPQADRVDATQVSAWAKLFPPPPTGA